MFTFYCIFVSHKGTTPRTLTEMDRQKSTGVAQILPVSRKQPGNHVATTRPINQTARCHHAPAMTRPCKISWLCNESVANTAQQSGSAVIVDASNFSSVCTIHGQYLQDTEEQRLYMVCIIMYRDNTLLAPVCTYKIHLPLIFQCAHKYRSCDLTSSMPDPVALS